MRFVSWPFCDAPFRLFDFQVLDKHQLVCRVHLHTRNVYRGLVIKACSLETIRTRCVRTNIWMRLYTFRHVECGKCSANS